MSYMDEEIVEEAKKLGLNLSQYCENGVKDAIDRLKGSDCPDGNKGRTEIARKVIKEPRAGFHLEVIKHLSLSIS